jgi:hypothetical protein
MNGVTIKTREQLVERTYTFEITNPDKLGALLWETSRNLMASGGELISVNVN